MMTMSEPDLVSCKRQVFSGREAEEAGLHLVQEDAGKFCNQVYRWHLLKFLGTFQHSFLNAGAKHQDTGAGRQVAKSKCLQAHLQMRHALLIGSHCSIHWSQATHHLCMRWFFFPELAEEKGRKTKHQQWKSEVNADWWTEWMNQSIRTGWFTMFILNCTRDLESSSLASRAYRRWSNGCTDPSISTNMKMKHEVI